MKYKESPVVPFEVDTSRLRHVHSYNIPVDFSNPSPTYAAHVRLRINGEIRAQTVAPPSTTVALHAAWGEVDDRLLEITGEYDLLIPAPDDRPKIDTSESPSGAGHWHCAAQDCGGALIYRESTYDDYEVGWHLICDICGLEYNLTVDKPSVLQV